ncbi:hypothetical protein Tco_0535234 [Tanacetum coccineum]
MISPQLSSKLHTSGHWKLTWLKVNTMVLTSVNCLEVNKSVYLEKGIDAVPHVIGVENDHDEVLGANAIPFLRPRPTIEKRTGEYDIWSMRMRQYICHTDHNLWDIIVNGDLEDEATPSGEQSSPLIPKIAKQLAARRNQERIKSILLLEIPDEYLLKFHNVPDAKSLWAVIKSRFGEDINQKFLRSFHPSWSQIALIMRNKLDIDDIDIDDLYNNLRVYEDELKRSSGSNSASQNLAFLSSENTNSTIEVSTTSRDFRQMDGDDLEELDLRWQVAMLTVRVKKSGRSQGRRPYGDNGRSNAQTTKSSSQALVAQDGLGGYDWSNDFEVEPVNYALMAISSSSSSSSSG